MYFLYSLVSAIISKFKEALVFIGSALEKPTPGFGMPYGCSAVGMIERGSKFESRTIPTASKKVFVAS